LGRLYASTSFRPIVDERLDPVFDPGKEAIIVGRTKKEQKREGFEGLLDIGAVCEKQASGQSFHGYRVYVDAKFPHIIFICGKRGGGKSYTLGVIAEELCRTRIGIGTVIVDPIGIYWSLKKENQNRKEISELERWGLKPQALDNVRILGPLGIFGQGNDVLDGSFSIKPSELTSEEWCLVFGLDRFKIQGLLIGEALEKVRQGYKVRKGLNEVEFIPGKGSDYTIEDIIDVMDRDIELCSEEKGYARSTRRSVIARLKAAENWGIFSREGTPIEEISVWDRVTVIDVSHPKLENQMRALIVGIIAKKILQARMENARREELGLAGEGPRIPVTWLMIDEAHLLIPRRGLTAASKPLIEYAKVGRKPGCALVFATQRPAATDDDILSQVDILIGHSLGLEDDIAALLRRVPAKLPPQLADSDFVRGIPSGFAILADQKTQQRAFLIQIRPRLTHHSGKESVPQKQLPPLDTSSKAGPGPTQEGRVSSIPSIWGEEAGRVPPSATVEKTPAEPLEIVSASPDEPASQEPAEAELQLPLGPPGLPSDLEAGEGSGADAGEQPEQGEKVPRIILGSEHAGRGKARYYADHLIVSGPESQEVTEEFPALEREEVAQEEEVGLSSLMEPTIGAESKPEPSAVQTSQVRSHTAEARALHGQEVESYPVVLRLDSAKGMALERIRKSWTGRPKEFIESVQLVHCPMFESTLSLRKQGWLTGRLVVRCTVLFDAYLRELVVDFRDFRRSSNLRSLTSLGERHLGVLRCVIHGRMPEECEAELGMGRAKIREAMTELSDKGIIELSEDRKGRLRGSLSKGIRFPPRPDSVKGQLPSTAVLRAERVLEMRYDRDGVEALVRTIYPGYRLEGVRLVHMPYYEVTYASEDGQRKEYINAFTGLFEDLHAELE